MKDTFLNIGGVFANAYGIPECPDDEIDIIAKDRKSVLRFSKQAWHEVELECTPFEDIPNSLEEMVADWDGVW